MSLNGKRDGFTVEDLREAAAVASLKRGRAEEILAEVTAAVAQWPALAAAARIDPDRIEQVAGTHRLNLPAG